MVDAAHQKVFFILNAIKLLSHPCGCIPNNVGASCDSLYEFYNKCSPRKKILHLFLSK